MANEKTTRLRYEGAATLTYRDGQGRRQTAYRGVEFETDADTAAALIESDAQIVSVDASASESESESESAAGAYDGLDSRGLKAEAKGRGLNQSGSNAALVARLTEDDEARAAAAAAASPHPSSSEAEAGAAPPVDASEIGPDSAGTDATGKTVGGPESAQVGTAGSAGSTSGAVTLGDLPASAKLPPGRG